MFVVNQFLMQISLWKVFITYVCVVKAMLFSVCKFDRLLIAKACKGNLPKTPMKLRICTYLREYQLKQMYRARKPVEHDKQPNGGTVVSSVHVNHGWHGFLSFVRRFFSKSFFPSIYFCVFVWRTCRLCFARERLHLEASSWLVLFPRRTASHPAWFDVAWNAQRKPPTP